MTNTQASKDIANYLHGNKSSDVTVIADIDGIETYVRFKLLRNKENKVEGEFGTSELLLRAFTEDGTADVEFLNHHLVNFKKSIEENIYEYLSLYLNGGIETITFG